MKRNEKGFTLIELLAVIVVLALIALIAYPNVARVIKNAREDSETIQYESLLSTVETYVAKHAATLGDTEEICIDDLKKDGLLKNKKLLNPKDNTEYKGCFTITWDTEYNQYNYTYNN